MVHSGAPVVPRTVKILGALVFGIGLVVATELLLRLFDSDGKVRHDPFAGFSGVAPMFEPAVRDDGVSVYRLSGARASISSPTGPRQPQREFLASKPEGAFRAFVIGGSSAAGVPYGTRYAFSAWLQKRLEAALPDLPIEVVNAAISGYASRRLLPVVREIAQYEPDLLIIYMGHNEVAEQRHYAHLIGLDPRVFRAWGWVIQTRLYQRTAQLLGVAPQPLGGPPPQVDFSTARDSMQMFAVLHERAGARGYATPRELEYRYLLYEFNLREMARVIRDAGSGLMVLTLSQNFSDWPPGASSHRPDLQPGDLAAWRGLVQRGDRLVNQDRNCEAAIAAYAAAIAIDAEFAELHFKLANCYRELGKLPVARKHYRAASDLDRVPHGAPTSFNSLLRDIALEHDAIFVDVDEEFTQASGDRLVGNDLFSDMMHPNIHAHQLIAASVARAMRQADLPAKADLWRTGTYSDPQPEAVYHDDPRLRVQELTVQCFACLLARRDDCARARAEELLALDPENEPARSVVDRLRK